MYFHLQAVLNVQVICHKKVCPSQHRQKIKDKEQWHSVEKQGHEYSNGGFRKVIKHLRKCKRCHVRMDMTEWYRTQTRKKIT